MYVQYSSVTVDLTLKEHFALYTIEGKYCHGFSSNRDLVMEPSIGYANVYRDGDSLYVGNRIFSTP